MQLAFIAAMTAVGSATLVGRQVDIELWPLSAVTLMAMVITAVVDFGRVRETAHATNRAGRS